ncbi:MAG: hypothetical protein AAFX04_13460 [Pseudomonadota bacterium]
MILLTLLLSLQAASQSSPESVDAEIVVIGQQLNNLSVMVGRDPKGDLTCSLDKSSGSLRLDKRLCKTAAKCVRDNEDNPSDAVIKACIDDKKPKLLAKLRREMKAERR